MTTTDIKWIDDLSGFRPRLAFEAYVDGRWLRRAVSYARHDQKGEARQALIDWAHEQGVEISE